MRKAGGCRAGNPTAEACKRSIEGMPGDGDVLKQSGMNLVAALQRKPLLPQLLSVCWCLMIASFRPFVT